MTEGGAVPDAQAAQAVQAVARVAGPQARLGEARAVGAVVPEVPPMGVLGAVPTGSQPVPGPGASPSGLRPLNPGADGGTSGRVLPV